MTIEQQIAALTTATTDLLDVVNVKKATLDAAVSDAESSAAASAADRVQTGQDRVATAADRVQTGLDASAASASASAAAISETNAANSASASATSANNSTGSAVQAATSANNAATSATNASNSATASATSATTALGHAQNAAAATGAALWVSGTTYAIGALVWSPINARVYRRLTAGAGTTDPSVDTTNWLVLSVVVEQSDIGTAPNEIPLNQFLGTMAYMDNTSVVITDGVIGGIRVPEIVSNVRSGEQYDGINSTTGLTLRGNGKNLLTHSSTLSSWTAYQLSVQSNAEIAPNGLQEAIRITETAVVDAHQLTSNAVLGAGTYTISAYVKADVFKGTVSIFCTGTGLTGGLGEVDLTSLATNNQGFYKDVGNGWLRLYTNFTLSVSSTVTIRLRLHSSTNDGTASIFVWGAQLVPDTKLTPYVRTDADAITTDNAPAMIDSPNGTALTVRAGTAPIRRGDMTFDLVSNTSLVIRVKGSDGVIRSGTVTLA